MLLFLRSPTFEPLSRPLPVVTKVLFLFYLATAKRVGELQAVSIWVAFQGDGDDLSLSYLPELIAKTESERNPLRQSFLVSSLSQFVGDLPEERLLCPVRAVRFYLALTSSISPHPRLLIVSLRCFSHALAKNALSFFFRKVIVDVDALLEGAALGAHSVLGMAMSAEFLRNWSVSKVLEAATWRSNPVFASFYFKDISFSLDNCSSLGQFVAAGSVLTQFFFFLLLVLFIGSVHYTSLFRPLSVFIFRRFRGELYVWVFLCLRPALMWTDVPW